MSPGTPRFSAAVVWGFLFFSALPQTPAAVVSHLIPNPPIVAAFPYANPQRQAIDVDANGTIDVVVETDGPGGLNGLGTQLSALGQTGVFGRDYPPPSNDFGFITIPLFSGEEIGPLLPARYGPLAGFYNNEILMAGGLLAGSDGFGGHYYGDFLFIRAYAGLRFEIAGELHYAWLDLQNDVGIGISVHGWAYETEPNTPIAAGAVPEPSVTILLVGGGIAFLARRRSEARVRHHARTNER